MDKEENLATRLLSPASFADDPEDGPPESKNSDENPPLLKKEKASLPHRTQTPLNNRGFDKYEGKGTVLSSIFTLASSAIGAGILSFPYAFKEAGLLTALITCFVLTSVMGFSLHAVVYATAEAQKTDPRIRSYEDLVLAATGPKTATFMEVIIVFYQYGVCVGFLIIIGDMLEPIMQEGLGANALFAHRQILIAICGIAICMPLCMLKQLFMLRHASILSVTSVLYMVIVIIMEEVDHTHGPTKKVELFESNFGVFVSIPLMCFALQCQIPSPLIYTELNPKIRSVRSMDYVLSGAYAICCLFYIPAGIFGYYTFGAGTISDVLTTSSGSSGSAYSISDKYAMVARCCIAAVATCGVPLNHFPARTATISLFNKVTAAFNKGESPSVRSMENVSNTFIVFETVIWTAITLGPALFVDNLGVVFSLSGASCGSAVIFIFPGIFWWKYGPQEPKLLRYISCGFLWTIGVVIMVVGTAITIKQQILHQTI